MIENGQDTLGQRVRLRRSELGLTMEQLAEQAGVSIRAISDIERGRTLAPRRATVRLLTAALGLDGPARTPADGLPAAGVPAARLPAPAPPPAPHVGPPAPATAAVDPSLIDGQAMPRQLPVSVRGFAGRATELSALTRLLDEARGPGGGNGQETAVITIGGIAGVGKTALAVHWAHRVAGRFPGGQLHLDLRGFGPSGQPVSPGDAVCGFLEALGVPSARIPVTEAGRFGLYRSLLAGRQVLVVLDNASDAGQVRPLLPGGPGCLALVTSRGQLTGLAVAEGAQQIPLSALAPAEASDLLAQRLGPGRLAAEPQAAGSLVKLTAGLPLALSIAAARAAAHPAAPLAGLAAELQDARGRLTGLDGEEASADVRAAFSWSYLRLSEPAARLFRLLSLHPGPDAGLAAVASLAGCDPATARQCLAELVAGGLVTEPAPGRFSGHDLLRTYAAELSRGGQAGDETAQARDRLLGYYLHTAHTGMMRLEITPAPLPLPPLPPGVAPDALGSEAAAQDWFRAEHDVLMAIVPEAAATGNDTHAWMLPATMTIYLLSSSRWHDWAAVQRAGVAAAQRLGDEAAQARAHRGLGFALGCLRHDDDAHAHLNLALGLYQRLQDWSGEAYTHCAIAGLLDPQGRHAEAVPHARRARQLYLADGNELGEAVALNDLGWAYVQLGELAEAVRCCEQSLRRCRECGNHTVAGAVLDSLGFSHVQLGHEAEAIRYYTEAVGEYRLIGHRVAEGCALAHLGDAHAAFGDTQAALRSWREALDILSGLHHRRVAELRAKVEAVPPVKPPAVLPGPDLAVRRS